MPGTSGKNAVQEFHLDSNDNKKHDLYLFLFHERYGREGGPGDKPEAPLTPPLPPTPAAILEGGGGGDRSAPWVTSASSSFTFQLKTWELSSFSRLSVYIMYRTASFISFALYVHLLYELIIFTLFSYIFLHAGFFFFHFCLLAFASSSLFFSFFSFLLKDTAAWDVFCHFS